MEFAQVYLGQRIGALKEVVFEPIPQGWLMLLRDEEDALLPLTRKGQACVFKSLTRASDLARLIGFDRVSVLRRLVNPLASKLEAS